MPIYNDSSSFTHSLPSPFVDGPFATREVKIASGNLSQFSVLGEVLRESATAAADGGNTGDGTITGVAFGADAEIGVYKLTCVSASSNSGTFSVVSPSGNRLDDATVGSAYSNDHLDFTINDGASDFIVGDSIDITVAAPSSREYVLSTSSAVDGSEKAVGILAEAVDASSSAKSGLMYVSGCFSDNGLVFGSGQSFSTVVDNLRKNNISLIDSTQ